MNIHLKPATIILGIFGIILVGLLIFFYLGSRHVSKNSRDIIQTVTPISIKYIENSLPKKVNQGVDLKSSVVKESMNEIQLLQPYLPYTTTVQFENESIDIVIPNSTIIEHPWTLQVNIFGIDYTVNRTDPLYAHEKNKFLFAVNEVKKWVREKGMDDSKIDFQWSDSAQDLNVIKDWLK